jgi:hypothetical protein
VDMLSQHGQRGGEDERAKGDRIAWNTKTNLMAVLLTLDETESGVVMSPVKEHTFVLEACPRWRPC